MKDPRLAKLYTSRQRCMNEYKSCSIYIANQSRIEQHNKVDEEKKVLRVEAYAENGSVENGNNDVTITVDCEFFTEGECRVMHRKLMSFEVRRCANYSQTCPLRERALRMRSQVT